MRATYIDAKGDVALRAARANDFLARVWHEWLEALPLLVPEAERQAWQPAYEQEAAGWKGDSPPKLAIRTLFEHADALGLYKEDYTLLCGIAHGVPRTLVTSYSGSRVPVHDDRFISPVVRAAVRFTIMTAAVWNDAFNLIDQARLEDLARRAEPPGPGSGS